MKATLTIQNADAAKILVAARIKGVKLGARTPIGTEESLLEVDFKNPADLYEMGRKMTQVKGNEFDAILKAEAEKAAAAQAAAAKKK